MSKWLDATDDQSRFTKLSGCRKRCAYFEAVVKVNGEDSERILGGMSMR